MITSALPTAAVNPVNSVFASTSPGTSTTDVAPDGFARLLDQAGKSDTPDVSASDGAAGADPGAGTACNADAADLRPAAWHPGAMPATGAAPAATALHGQRPPQRPAVRPDVAALPAGQDALSRALGAASSDRAAPASDGQEPIDEAGLERAGIATATAPGDTAAFLVAWQAAAASASSAAAAGAAAPAGADAQAGSAAAAESPSALGSTVQGAAGGAALAALSARTTLLESARLAAAGTPSAPAPSRGGDGAGKALQAALDESPLAPSPAPGLADGSATLAVAVMAWAPPADAVAAALPGLAPAATATTTAPTASTAATAATAAPAMAAVAPLRLTPPTAAPAARQATDAAGATATSAGFEAAATPASAAPGAWAGPGATATATAIATATATATAAAAADRNGARPVGEPAAAWAPASPDAPGRGAEAQAGALATSPASPGMVATAAEAGRRNFSLSTPSTAGARADSRTAAAPPTRGERSADDSTAHSAAGDVSAFNAALPAGAAVPPHAEVRGAGAAATAVAMAAQALAQAHAQAREPGSNLPRNPLADAGGNKAAALGAGSTPMPSAMAWVTAAQAGMAESAAAPSDGHIAASPGSAEFAPQLAAHITTFVRDGLQHARLELNPAEMGPLTVQIQLDGNAARVHLAAEHAGTRAALEQAMPQLAGSLRESGLTLSGGGVFEQPRQPQSQAQSQPQAGNNGSRGSDSGQGGTGDPRRGGDSQGLIAAAGASGGWGRRQAGLVDLVA